MKKIFFLITSIQFFFTISGFDISSKVENNSRLFVFDGNIFSDILFFEAESKKNFNEKLDLYFDIQFENDLSVVIKNIKGLTDTENFNKNFFKIYEAKIFFRKYPFDFIDVTVGKTFYNIGKGFTVSPADIVNPDDLSDPLRMDRKVTKGMFLVESYFKFFDLNIIYSPFFVPSILPKGYIDLKDYFGNLNIKDSIIYPENIFQSSELFIEILKNINNFQTSCFYGYTRTTTPLPSNLKIQMVTPILAFADAKFHFPRMNTFGLSFSGSFADASIWFDFVHNYIRDNKFKIDLTDFGKGIVDTSFSKDKIFFNFLIGFDYNISGKYYFMTQFVHGLRGTYGEENLNDYLFFYSRISFLNEKILFEPLNFAYEIVDWKNLKNEGGLLINPKITFNLMDDFSFGFSFYYINGTERSYFKKIEKFGCLELTTKVFF
ncbi:MAG: hypothetical protein ABIN35_05340 [candidate division WOR-3 bacterium]